MTHTAVALVVLLSISFGFVTGFVLGRAVHVDRCDPDDQGPPGGRGRVGVMRRLLGLIGSALNQPIVVATLLSISLLLSATGTFLNVRTADKVGNVVDCSIAYNRANGIARDERSGVARKGVRSELRLWQRFQGQFSQADTSQAEVLATIDKRIGRLREILHSQTANPYPRPESCDDGKFTPADTETAQEAAS